jgi:hypothetical protein
MDTKRLQADLAAEIRVIHVDSDGSMGHHAWTAELPRRGWPVNHKRAERPWPPTASSVSGPDVGAA